MQKLFRVLYSALAMLAFDDGVGRFDSIDGTYDEQTSFDFERNLYFQARTKSMVTPLQSMDGGVNQMGAYEPGEAGVQGCIDRKQITEGDMVRCTLEENVKGKVTYGDMPVRSGGFLSYKNKEFRVNNIDTPALQVPGEMSQQRAKRSLGMIPPRVQRQLSAFMAEQYEFELIPAILEGASPGLLKATTEGGLGVSLGSGSGAGAGVPLMNKWFYTHDTGFCDYSATPATFNSTVNDAIDGIDAEAADKVTLTQLDIIREKMDTELFEPTTFMGKKYKAIAGCDPAIMWRIKRLFDDWYKYSGPRDSSNPFWNTGLIEYEDMLFFSWPNLKKYRPSANSTNSRPDFGPLASDVDPRTYTTSSTNGLIVFMGGGAVLEGYNGSISTTTEYFRHKKAMEYAAHQKMGYVRGEWYSKDGRTDSADNTENRSLMIAAFYEPGVGQ
jgi:hypothetical protein